MTIISKTKDGLYQTQEPVTRQELIGFAQRLVAEQFVRQGTLCSADLARQFLNSQLAQEEREVFCVIFLDRQNRVISFERLFYGTLDQASVHPREIVKRCLLLNAGAVILAHNHPSGVPDPSTSDQQMTKQLIEALSLVDVLVLDHFVVGGTETVSFSERGLLG